MKPVITLALIGLSSFAYPLAVVDASQPIAPEQDRIAFTTLQRTFVSESGETTVTIVQNSDWEQPGATIGSYEQAGGAGGILTNTGQDDPMGFYTQFRDTAGAERCVGRMHIFIDDSGRDGFVSETVWQVDGTVPDYRCSTVGQTFRLNVRQIN